MFPIWLVKVAKASLVGARSVKLSALESKLVKFGDALI